MIFTRSGAHDRIRKIVEEPDEQRNEMLDKVAADIRPHDYNWF